MLIKSTISLVKHCFQMKQLTMSVGKVSQHNVQTGGSVIPCAGCAHICHIQKINV